MADTSGGKVRHQPVVKPDPKSNWIATKRNGEAPGPGLDEDLQRFMAHPESGRLSSQQVRVLQRTVGNQAVVDLLKKHIPTQTSVSQSIQRSYSDVEKKVKAEEVVTKLDLEEAAREVIGELVQEKGFQDALGMDVDLSRVKTLPFKWSDQYSASFEGFELPPRIEVMRDIRNGVFKMALGHELGHWVREVKNQPGAFSDLEGFVNSVANWGELEREHINKKGEKTASMELWKEEILADLKGVWMRYQQDHHLPTKSELAAYQWGIGLENFSHPSGRLRLFAIKKLIEQLKPHEE